MPCERYFPLPWNDVGGRGSAHRWRRSSPIAAGVLVVALTACSGGTNGNAEGEELFEPTLHRFADGSVAGNPAGGCLVPADAMPESETVPDRVVGDGTPGSCTGEAFRQAVARGGRIGFDCGRDSETIVLESPARVFNDAASDVVIDGGGRVTLSGGGRSRILYMNTCDSALHWTTSHCQDQETPRVVVQNLSFVDGDSRGEAADAGGGAIWARGGRLKVVNCRFFGNRAADSGPDVGGGAIRAFDQSRGRPLQVLSCTFGAAGRGNVASNGGALSSIGVSWSIWNSVFRGNTALGLGGNPAVAGTPGGGSGGAIYNDGNTMTLSVCGSVFEGNTANAYGAAIFFVSNNHDGLLRLVDSRISGNFGGGWHVLPGVAMHEDTRRVVVNSVLE